ncbi:tRNA pseudouridine(55) synthase TruB [Basilea psittacipulmonis]|uniref:tRNA pseudouridine synthase B n=1 Tax=Basilea psittacipulmonis DSM 24701 TaxID=1072685 RepID=A0A077DJ37_9BURK|nr:tRNA pseudouridine(55) synthase TruB [Basilea psittacipulmonis]AIL33148.1 tRNA pseudouridine synthase B [Basilea psittacipulmonis DSM 24701]
MSRRRKGDIVDGVLLLDKPKDLSSNFALQRARRTLNAQKAGHTGTLDPFATGLLICCFGKATKICGQMLNVDKRYVATLCLGSETDSGDYTGEVVKSVDTVPSISDEQLDECIRHFIGEIEQIPPMYSALKKDGQPLYKLARKGIEVERAARQVTIYDIKIISRDKQEVVLDVFCSKGTYIRTLAQDIGRFLGCYAHLSALRRTEVGMFKIDDAIGLEAFQDEVEPLSRLISVEQLPDELFLSKLKKEHS